MCIALFCFVLFVALAISSLSSHIYKSGLFRLERFKMGSQEYEPGKAGDTLLSFLERGCSHSTPKSLCSDLAGLKRSKQLFWEGEHP